MPTTKRINRSTHKVAALNQVPFFVGLVLGTVAVSVVFRDDFETLGMSLIAIAILTLILGIPTLALYLNHYNAFEGVEIEYDDSGDGFLLHYNNKSYSFSATNVEDATMYAPFQAGKTSLVSKLPWSQYYYLKVTCNNGTVVQLSSLLVEEHDYRKIGCRFYQKKFDLFPLLEKNPAL